MSDSCFSASYPTAPRPRASRPRRLPVGLLSAVPLVALVAFGAYAWTETADGVFFTVFGDNRGDKDGLQPEVFKRLVRQMAALNPEFVIGTGDYVYGADSQETLRYQWSEFFRAMAPLQEGRTTYFVPAPGNHEIAGGGGNALFLQYFKRLYFSFDRGGSHFIVLNTEVPGQESRIADAQRVWLKKDLAAAANASHIFVAMHRPLFPVSIHKGDSLDMYPAERDGLHRIFVQHRVTCVFLGHEHLYNRQTRDGVVYIITGGGGAALYAEPGNGGFYHFLSVKANRLGYNIDVTRVQ
jgi:3',5'-cyclic AMP phosphodiesterase CpdA